MEIRIAGKPLPLSEYNTHRVKRRRRNSDPGSFEYVSVPVKRKAEGRCIELAVAILDDLKQLLEEGLIDLDSLDPDAPIRLFIKIWIDGSTLCRMKLVCIRWAWHILPTVMKGNLRPFTAPRLWISMPVGESKKGFESLAGPLKEELQSIVLPFDVPFTQADNIERTRSVIVRVSEIIADMKASGFAFGNQRGNSHYPCGSCLIRKDQLHNFVLGQIAKDRDWKELSSIVKKRIESTGVVPRASRCFGQVDYPITHPHTPEELALEYVWAAFICQMHFIENFGPTFYSAIQSKMLEKKRKLFCSNLCQAVSQLSSPGDSLSNMTVADQRNVWKVIPSYLNDAQFGSLALYLEIKQVVSLFLDLIGHFYNTDHSSWNQKSILQLHVVIFSFGQWVRRLFPPSGYRDLYMRPLHYLEAHLPLISRCFLPNDLVTEMFESEWRTMRNIEKNMSNHKQNQVRNIHMRVSAIAEHRKAELRNAEFWEAVEEDFIATTNQHRITMPKWMVDSEDFSFFLLQIRDYLDATVGSCWYATQEDGSLEWCVGPDDPCLPFPTFGWFSERSQEEVILRREEDYQLLLQQNRVNPAFVEKIAAAKEVPVLDPANEPYDDWGKTDLCKEAVSRRRAYNQHELYKLTNLFCNAEEASKATLVSMLTQDDRRRALANPFPDRT